MHVLPGAAQLRAVKTAHRATAHNGDFHKRRGMECWSAEVLEYWGNGVLECWKRPSAAQYFNAPLLHRSTIHHSIPESKKALRAFRAPVENSKVTSRRGWHLWRPWRPGI